MVILETAVQAHETPEQKKKEKWSRYMLAAIFR